MTPSTTAVGIATRNRRTRRLWRRAARNTRAFSVRPRDAKARGAWSSTSATSACDALCDACETMVKRLTPQPVPGPDRAAQIASQFLANPTPRSLANVAPPRHIPLNLLELLWTSRPARRLVHHARPGKTKHI